MVAALVAAVPRALTGLLHWAGRRCQLCAAVLGQGDAFPLCPACREVLAPRRGGYCPRCGICYADPAAPTYPCLACRLKSPPWTALAFHGPYSGAIKEIVHRHKFGHDHGLGTLLGFLVGQIWELRGLERPDRVVPVPMLPSRVVRRGFNQSAELARMLGKILGLPPDMTGLAKVRDTKAQSSLGRSERHGNVAGAFAAGMDMSGLHVLLVDDVMTTGATITACAKACLGAGAARVDAFVLARAL